jgi:transcriptional regulator NrdR family protein
MIQCPVCASTKTIVLSNPKERGEALTREHHCRECNTDFETKQEITRVRIPMPKAQGSFLLPVKNLDEKMTTYLLREGPFPGKPREMGGVA